MKPDMNKDFLRVRLCPPILIGNVTDIFQRTTSLDCISALLYLYLLSNMVIFFLNTQEALVADTGGILASGGTFTLYICNFVHLYICTFVHSLVHSGYITYSSRRPGSSTKIFGCFGLEFVQFHFIDLQSICCIKHLYTLHLTLDKSPKRQTLFLH